MKSMLKAPKLLVSILLSILLVVLITTYSHYKYLSNHSFRLALIDQQLRLAILGAQPILDSFMHSSELTLGSVSAAQDLETSGELTLLAGKYNVEYVYSLILQDESRILFTSSSMTPKEIRGEEEYEEVYWTHYEDVDNALFKVFNEEQEVFLEYQDRWGEHRSLFIPFRAKSGRVYVVAADAELSKLASIRSNAITESIVVIFLVLFLVILRNFSSYRHAKSLFEVQQKFDLALSSADIGIWEWHPETNVFFLSGGISNPLNYSNDNTATTLHDFLRLVHPDDQAYYKDSLRLTMHAESEGGGDRDIQFRILNNNGEYIWMRSHGGSISGGKGQHRIGVLENINALKTAEINLSNSLVAQKKQDKFISTLLTSTPDLISFKSEEGVYVHCSDSFEDFLGAKKEKIIGKRDDDFVLNKVSSVFMKNHKEALQSKVPVKVEEWVVFSNSDAPRLLETLKIRVLGADGMPAGVLSIARDITERYELILRLEAATKVAVSANHSKSMFLANMSHEIRTPLNSVLGYSQLLIQDKSLSGETHHKIRNIFSSGNRLLSLINDILDLSKIEAGKVQVEKSLVDINVELEEIENIIRIRAQSKGLKFNHETRLPSKCVANIDKQKLGQVLLNLLGNAIKFTVEGRVSLFSYYKDNAFFFIVSDTGPGISHDEREKLFTPFTQGKAGVLSGGTGLGLALSKRLAESLGGDLTLESELGEGARLTFSLPSIIENIILEQNDQALKSYRLPEDVRYNAMVVEDDQQSRELLVSLLEATGLSVFSCDDGLEGVECFATHSIDIVFTDIRMPNMTGDELLKEIRKKPNGHIPIVAVSASSLIQEQSFYRSIGFDDYIEKPIRFDDIYAAISQYLNVTFEGASEQAVEVNTETEHFDIALTEVGRAILADLLQAAKNGDAAQATLLFQQLPIAQLEQGVHKELGVALKNYQFNIVEALLKKVLE